MSKFELRLPKMGESVAEATLTSWLKEIGDTIEMDEAVFEIATDKVDSEVPSEVEGVLLEKKFEIDDVIQVGDVVAVIQTEKDILDENSNISETTENQNIDNTPGVAESITQNIDELASESSAISRESEGRFYSPLVRNMASKEGISQGELDQIKGSGKEGRVTKNDMLDYIEAKSTSPQPITNTVHSTVSLDKPPLNQNKATPLAASTGDEIIELSRMGKLISKHMVESVQTSAHVQSFIEADVSTIWNWRKKMKGVFMEKEGENLTFTPIFLECIAKALRDFPMMNISLNGNQIIKKKDINLGMAAALPDGNLIVPVIKNADQLNLVGLTKKVNDLANRARTNQLKPDEIQDGTYTVTNVGTFGSIMGTPIINQPQVGILALGAIRKTPAVIETPEGDFIGIRYKMYLSHSYDHRVVNGALGGQFVKTVKDYLENWDSARSF